jgi:hypothetical protein
MVKSNLFDLLYVQHVLLLLFHCWHESASTNIAIGWAYIVTKEFPQKIYSRLYRLNYSY